MIKIFIVCHKKAYILQNELLIPIQVGAKKASIRLPDMIYDDIGENISEKNDIYCELTAQYWAWKNIESDYYGFFHYRRYLAFDEVCPIDAQGNLINKRRPCPYTELDDIRMDLSRYGLQQNIMENVIQKYDILTVLRERINVTVYRQFCQYHQQGILDAVIKILKERYPQYSAAADKYLNSKDIYYMNMFIMKKQLFKEYCTWLFDILGIFEQSDEFLKLEDERKRLLGYIGERLFGIFYVYKTTNGAVCAELPYLKFYNTEEREGQEKHKTNRNVKSIKLGPTNVEIKIDMRKFNKMFPAGSRRRIFIRNIFLR
ncbi:DUF4422 domain-containing protein [Clostridium sp. AM58-1XD]|nr:DUF4422 domain-containing protein [Clostridium sp. AM58-1XD]